ncbi:MAG: SAM-dependent methyltransferase, partial [Tissierella sp.]|nr:SAM-dependent methyltransferase [Tissierella sp.]
MADTEIKIDTVPGTDYKILQNNTKFSYGIDAILLSNFAKPKGMVMDLGTGTGIIPIRMA